MANFPGSLDSWSDYTDSVDTFYASILNNIQDAIMAIEAKVGKGSYASNLHSLVYNFFASNTSVFLYENITALTGWTIESISDRVLAIKGGSIYTTGGTTTQGDSWDNLKQHYHSMSHYHSLGNHNHQLTDFIADRWTNDTTWGSGGATPINNTTAKTTGRGLCSARSYAYPITNDMYCANQGDQNTGTYSSNTSAGTLDPRPTAALGIIVTKD